MIHCDRDELQRILASLSESEKRSLADEISGSLPPNVAVGASLPTDQQLRRLDELRAAVAKISELPSDNGWSVTNHDDVLYDEEQ
jgi:hypothetical protein